MGLRGQYLLSLLDVRLSVMHKLWWWGWQEAGSDVGHGTYAYDRPHSRCPTDKSVRGRGKSTAATRRTCTMTTPAVNMSSDSHLVASNFLPANGRSTESVSDSNTRQSRIGGDREGQGEVLLSGQIRRAH